MNIHIDSTLHKELTNRRIAKFKIGSYLYGCNDINSDQDWLNIYQTSEGELHLPCQINHQFQFKDGLSDHNWTSLHGFVTNIINGDSTINFELVWSGGVIGTPLEFLNENLSSLITYQSIKSFLGMASRDIKHFGKRSSLRDRQKGLHHIIRSHLAATAMIKSKEGEHALRMWHFYIKDLKQAWTDCSVMDDSTIKAWLETHKLHNKLLRDELNSLLFSKKIVRNLNPSILKELTLNLMYHWNKNRNNINEMPLWFDLLTHSFEHWVEYNK